MWAVPAVAARLDRLILAVTLPLESLVRASFAHLASVEVVQVVRDGAVPFWHDTLPPPDGHPFLRLPPDPALSLGPGRHVGICWSASAKPPVPDCTHDRALPLGVLALPLLAVPGVTLHSLQKEHPRARSSPPSR